MRVLISLAILVTVALLASSRRWWTLRRTPIGAALVTGGWLAVAVGMLLGPEGLHLIRADQIRVLDPLVLFCLGWVGFMVGLQLDRRIARLVPPGTVRLVLIDAALSVIVLGAATYLALSLTDRDAPVLGRLLMSLLIGIAGMAWAAEVRSLGRGGATDEHLSVLLRSVAGLGSVLAVFIYGLLFKALDPSMSSISLIAVGEGLAVSMLIALTMGLMVLWLARVAGRGEPQFLVVLLGLVSFTAGAAATLGYSPLFVSMLCGAVVMNLPGELLNRFKRVIVEAEQPMAMAVMLVAGVRAELTIGLTGLSLVILVLAARTMMKLGVMSPMLRGATGAAAYGPLLIGPMRQNALAVALVLGYVVSMHAPVPGAHLSGNQLLTVVIVIGVVSEMLPLFYRLLRRVRQVPDTQAA